MIEASDLQGSDGGDVVSQSMSDVFLNVAIIMMLVAITTSQVPDTLGVSVASTSDSAADTPPKDHALTLVYDYNPGLAALSLDGVSGGTQGDLERLGADDTVLVVIPATAPYASAMTALRDLSTMTQARIKQVETTHDTASASP